ncbi:TPA: hypothetical protein ACHVIE_002227 [Streptococcus suis]
MIKKFINCICLLLCSVALYACQSSQEAKTEVITSTQSISLEEVEEKLVNRKTSIYMSDVQLVLIVKNSFQI